MTQEIAYRYENNPNLTKDMNNFLIELNMENKSQNTIEDYKTILLQFLSYLRVNNIEKYKKINNINFIKTITQQDLSDYITFYFQRGNKPASLNKKKSTLVSFYDYLTEKKIVENNIARNLKKAKLKKSSPKYLTKDEGNLILDTIKESNQKFKIRDYCIITLFLNCGMRISELTNLKISETDLINSTILIDGKGDKERTGSLTPSCIIALNDYLRERELLVDRIKNPINKDALFISQKGNKISTTTIQKMVKEYTKLTGIDKNIHPHLFRHTCASLMCQGGMSISDIQEVLGHESISTTQKYAHVDKKEIKNKIIKFNPFANRDN